MALTRGLTPYLTYQKEKEQVKFIINCSKMGYRKTQGEVLRIVGETKSKKGRLNSESSVSQGWWRCFRKYQRQPVEVKTCIHCSL